MPLEVPPAFALKTEVLELARRWAAFPETAMRTAALASYLGQVGDARGVWVLEWLIRGAKTGHVGCLKVYAGLVMPSGLATALGAERMRGLAQAVREANTQVAQFWLAELPTDGAAEAGENSDALSTLALVHRDLRKLTLGERRALGRKAKGDGLKRLIYDPDPGVITNVLNNPRTTEETVLAICARRPTVPPPLLCVLGHGRWNSRYRIKLALVRNPFMPHPLAVNLLVFLRDTDLKTVREDNTARPALRLAAERLMQVGRDGDAVADRDGGELEGGIGVDQLGGGREPSE